MFCKNCGSRISDAHRFCGSCGTAVSPSGAVARPADPLPPAAPPPPVATPPAHLAPPPPAYAQAAPPSVAAYPEPPNIHWLVVLILSAITYGLGGFVWGFKQAFFVRKLDPASKGVQFLALASVAMVVQVALYFLLFGTLASGNAGLLTGLILITNLFVAVFACIGIFGMRKSLLNHYNTVEPIGLRLNGFMTFFFNILYFQYHFSRIAAWKKTGVLS